MEHITVREFEAAMKALTDRMAEGFSGINARLDVLNGQTRRHGEAIAGHDVRISVHDRDISTLQGGREGPPVIKGLSGVAKTSLWSGIGIAVAGFVGKMLGLL